MKSTVILVLTGLVTVASPRVARGGDSETFIGEDFTRRDRTALLYQTKLSFTDTNVPIVNVLVMEGEDGIGFSAAGPLTFRPDGEGGATIRVMKGPMKCRAMISDGAPAKIRYWVALGRVSARNLDAVRTARDEWTAKGISLKTFERGSVFGFYGRILDNRTLTFVESESTFSAEKARNRRDELSRRTGVATLEIYEEIVEHPKGLITVSCTGLPAEMTFPGYVEIVPSADSTFRVENVEFGKGFHWHGREDRSYRGRLILTPDRNGKLAAVNSVDAETLLKGLVPSEIYVDSPMEALKAQAVAARGELFAKLGNRHTADPYMICADVHCQVYRGIEKEHPRASKAVDDTRGRMLFHEGALVDAVYSASCGGHTESGAKVWQGSDHSYLTGVPDAPKDTKVFQAGVTEESVADFLKHPPKGAYCGATRYGKDSFRWTKTLTFDQIREGIRTMTGQDVGGVKSIKVLERGDSGRVTRLEVAGTLKTVVLSPELTIRKALGGLRSSLFVHAMTGGGRPTGYTFKGAGFGHGVGMCQHGAIGMAEKGISFEDILRHYFSGAEVVSIY